MTTNESGTKMSKKNKKQQQLGDEQETPELTKEETSIARYLRLSCPNKQANLAGMKVDFFIGSKLVDCLMESKWGPGTLNPQTSKKTDAFLPSRQACINFMQRLMHKQLFYRAYKVYKESSETKQKDTNTDTTPNLRKRKEKKETQSMPATPASGAPSSPESNDSKQQKKKFKLEMHDEQRYFDSNEPFVWVYDPTSTKTYIIGSLLILGAIGICLFPLWPSQVREGVYYLSLAGASFLGAILGLAAFKYVLFAFLWTVTLGKVQFWLFPNLTEDVGFFESFVPVYNCKIGSSETKKEENKESSLSSSQEENVSSENQQIESNENLEKTDATINNLVESFPTIKDISKSTIEICKSDTPKGSPAVNKNKLKKKDSLVNDEDGFELVDDDDLIKEDK